MPILDHIDSFPPLNHKPNLVPPIIGQPPPLQQQPEHVNLHILLPQRLTRPLSPRLRNHLPSLHTPLHQHGSRNAGVLSAPAARGVGVIGRPGEISQRGEQAVQPDIHGYEMLPSGQPPVPPTPEDPGPEGQAPALQEGQKAAGEAGAVHVHEVAVAPVVLEVGGRREAELGVLGRAVTVPGAGDAADDGDVEGEVQRVDRVRVGEGLVRVLALGIGEEDGQGRRAGSWSSGEVVGQVDETLPRHAFPGASARDAFGGGAAPEEGAFFFGKRRVWMLIGCVVVDFVYVVPGGGVEYVGVAVNFALGEDGEQLTRGLKGRGAKVEAVEIAKVWLMAGGGGEGPVAKKDAMGVRCGAGRAEDATVPGGCSLGKRRGRAGYGAYGESVGARVIFKRSCGTQVFWYMPGRSSISAPTMLCRFAKVLGRSPSNASKVLQILEGNCRPWLIVEVERQYHVGQVA